MRKETTTEKYIRLIDKALQTGYIENVPYWIEIRQIVSSYMVGEFMEELIEEVEQDDNLPSFCRTRWSSKDVEQLQKGWEKFGNIPMDRIQLFEKIQTEFLPTRSLDSIRNAFYKFVEFPPRYSRK